MNTENNTSKNNRQHAYSVSMLLHAIDGLAAVRTQERNLKTKKKNLKTYVQTIF